MSFTKTKYDSCQNQQQQQSNKSIFNYVLDNSMYINKNECNNYTAPFLTYIPTGVSSRSIDIENDLKGISRINTKCINCKYIPENIPESMQNNASPTNEKMLDIYPNNKKECEHQYNILPNGYLKR